MMLPNGNFIGNRAGVTFANATQTNAGSSTNAVYTLPNHTFRALSGLGIIVCDFDLASDGNSTGMIFKVNGAEIPVTNAADTAITGETAAGLHILVFNKFANKLQLIV